MISPLYPVKKTKGWWIVVGNPASNALLAIKRVSPLVGESKRVSLSMVVPDDAPLGRNDLKMYLISDCLVGCDQEIDFSVDVVETMEE